MELKFKPVAIFKQHLAIHVKNPSQQSLQVLAMERNICLAYRCDLMFDIHYHSWQDIYSSRFRLFLPRSRPRRFVTFGDFKVNSDGILQCISL